MNVTLWLSDEFIDYDRRLNSHIISKEFLFFDEQITEEK